MSEALFEFAFSDMLWKTMAPEDLEEITRLHNIMYPQLTMRDDIAAINEHAGIGGTSHGLKSIGIPTAMGVDAWDPVNVVRRPTEERTMGVWLGTEQGQAHPDDQVEIYADALAGRRGHFSASPPCQMLTSAGTGGLTAEEVAERALKGIPPILNSLYTAQQMQKHPDIDLNSWHVEQAKEAIPVLLNNQHLLFEGETALDRDFGKRVLAMLRGKGEMGTLRQNPRMDAINYGAPSTRNRMIIGEGWSKNPTHYDQTRRKNPVPNRSPSRSILDYLPHLQQQWVDNKEKRDEWLQALIQTGRLTETGASILGDGPQISISGAINPGKGNKGPVIHPLGIRAEGSTWDDSKGGRNKQKRSFSHTYPANRHTSGQTHNPPAVMYDRQLEPEEWLAIQTFNPKYPIDAIRDLVHQTYTTGKSQKALHTALGNVLVPAVSRSIGSSAFDIPLPRVGSPQKTLNEFR